MMREPKISEDMPTGDEKKTDEYSTKIGYE